MNKKINYKLKCFISFPVLLCTAMLPYQLAVANKLAVDDHFKLLNPYCISDKACADADLTKTHGMAKISSDDEYNGFALIVADNLLDQTFSSKQVYQIFSQENNDYAISINLDDKTVAIAKTQKEADLLAMCPRQLFYAEQGQTLKQTVERWASYQGIKVIWEASVDYKLAASAQFEGQLLAKNGALNNLLKAFEDADHPLEAQLKTNNVLLIKAKSYSANMVVMQK
ncbi:TcpQ domain-containing protein [Fastidiosibacter lacustris]|uniref:TcpQ domain-containing protein n=1 Tax=Fastidiosibacter lacustris TaxID=2056695 RepID=UPI0013003CB1|nr:TcpQ domain-containing protein [Fastidiosibacter lacustris]